MIKQIKILATARVHPSAQVDFAAWHARHSKAASQFSGFISSDIIGPPNGNSELPWTIILNFDSEERFAEWKKSEERAAILGEVIPLLNGESFSETIHKRNEENCSDSQVTEVIFSKVKPGMTNRYNEWAIRIQAAQAKYPGYRGMYLQPPAEEDGGHWVSILRYDSSENLGGWMRSQERRTLIAEAQEFIESEELLPLSTSFPGWVPIDPITGKGPPDWKTALLVLLGLFPIVMLEMKYLTPLLNGLQLPVSPAIFLGNVLSVALTSFLTMPWFVRVFTWWLFPNPNSSSTTLKGIATLLALFALEVASLWRLLS